MRDIALVPKRDIFECRLRIGAYNARQAGNLLAAYRIALVWHGRASALARGKGLLGLAHFGALQMTNLQGDFLQRGRDDRQRGKKFRVAVALDDLRSDRRRLEAKPPADGLFDFHAEMSGIADRAGNLPHRHLPRGMAEAFLIAAIFGEPVGDLEPEGDGLGVNAVGAADLRSVLKFVRALFEHLAEALEARLDQARSLAHLQRLRRIHDVVRSQSVV